MLLSDADVGIQPQPSPQIPANPLSSSQTPNLTAKTQPKLLSDADVGIQPQLQAARLMDTVPFDPSKPFTVVSDPAQQAQQTQQAQQVPFDPSKPFTVVRDGNSARPMRTATNHQTGQRIADYGDGKWVPLQ
jgi:hypothetical protein